MERLLERVPAEPPTFELAGFSVWVLSATSEGWLQVIAHCRATRAQVQAIGEILHIEEIQSWLNQLKELDTILTGTATLQCVEPNLGGVVKLKNGHGAFTIDITPDHRSQKHTFTFDVDQRAGIESRHFRARIRKLARTKSQIALIFHAA